MSQADTYCTERYWCPVGVSVRSGVTCPCWNSSQANSAASAPHYHLLCRLTEAPSGHSLHLHHLFCRDFSLKFGSVTAAGVCALLFPEIGLSIKQRGQRCDVFRPGFSLSGILFWQPWWLPDGRDFFFFFLNGGFFYSPLFWTLLVYDSKCKCDSMNLLKAK